MGRAPCCDKTNVKKGPWSPEEDAKLKAYIQENGTGGNWIALPQKIGLKRCGKSCRLRWLNYLRPNIKHGGFSEEEDNIICSLYVNIGSRWSIIAGQLPGRTDNDIKNYWNTRLKKKLLSKQKKDQQARRGVKQDMKREIISHDHYQSSMVNPMMMMSQTQYWPELPVPTPIINPLNQYPFEVSFSQDHLYHENTISTTPKSTDSAGLQNSQYIGTGPNMYQELESLNFPVELSEQLDYSNQFYGMEMVNGTSTTGTGTSTTSAESNSWGDISSLLVYHPSMPSQDLLYG